MAEGHAQTFTRLTYEPSLLYSILKVEKLLDSRRSTMMPPPDFQIYLRPPHVTLTFDLLTPKLTFYARANWTTGANFN